MSCHVTLTAVIIQKIDLPKVNKTEALAEGGKTWKRRKHTELTLGVY